MYYYWIHVFNYEWFVGSFYNTESDKKTVTELINSKYGKGSWTRYTIE